jgi:formylglycine-generating enzyme
MNNRLFVLILSLVTAISCSYPAQEEQIKPISINSVTDHSEIVSVSYTKNHTVIDSVPMVEIRGGFYTPLFGSKDSLVKVESFLMDVYPVTIERYLKFVKANSQWQRSKVKRIYADKNYLSDWENDTTPGKGTNPDSPVINVSWFAAKAYADCVGKELPTVSQWEYVAMADEETPDARNKKSYNQYLLEWFEKPGANKNAVGQTNKNYWGVWDMYGLVWEWTFDFNEVMLSGESRRDVTSDNARFCGGGTSGANDLMNYAAFMRNAFRGSLKANYCIKNQGFRCVKNHN